MKIMQLLPVLRFNKKKKMTGYLEDSDTLVKKIIIDDFCCEVIQQSSQMLFTESISRENTAIFSGINTHQKPTNDT